MSITFPRELPPGGFLTVDFELELQQVLAAERGGRLVSVDLGPPRWRAEFQTPPMDMVRLGAWRAWLASLRGAARTFVGVDPFRRYPAAYRTGFAGLTRPGGAAFDGTALSVALSAARDLVSLTGLPAGLRLQPGDYISLTWESGAKRSLHRVLDDAAADAAGLGAWTVEPIVPEYVTAAIATLAEPGCIMRLSGEPEIEMSLGRTGSVRFTALQHLEA